MLHTIFSHNYSYIRTLFILMYFLLCINFLFKFQLIPSLPLWSIDSNLIVRQKKNKFLMATYLQGQCGPKHFKYSS